LLKQTILNEAKIMDSTLRGQLHLKLGGGYFQLNQFDSAIVEYSLALDRLENKDSTLIADSYFFRAQAKDYKGDLLGGMRDYQSAQAIYQLLGDESYVNYLYGEMAILYSKYEIFDKAEEIRYKLNAAAEKDGREIDLAIQFFNQATDYDKQGRDDEKLIYLLKADSDTPFESRDFYIESILKLNLSIFYGEHQNPKKQTDYFEAAKKLIDQSFEIPESNPDLLTAKALMAKNKGNISGAIYLANESLTSAKSSKHMDYILKGYQLLSDLNFELGNFEQAFIALESRSSYKDSIFAENQAATFSYYQTLYETEKKELEILTKNLQIGSIKSLNKARIRLYISIILSLVVLSVLLFLWKNLQHQKKKKQLQSRFSQELLKNQETERTRISKDLHDGLGQSLLLIKNKVALSKDTSTGELLDTAISELRSIARSLHSMQLEKLGLSKAANHLLDQIDTETKIFVSSEIQDLKGILKKDQELQLYRILQESINTVIKHSEASALSVIFRKNHQGVELKIEDNGKGFDFSEKLNDFQSLALKTLKERIASMEGSMRVISSKGNGTSLTFIVHV
jgi:signal transduction histidine kinase